MTQCGVGLLVGNGTYEYHRVIGFRSATANMISFELSDEQKEIRDWVHSFAEKEIRPFAHQYDESEEFPWPIVKMAAEVGLYGTEFMQQTFVDGSGIMPEIVGEVLTWGSQGIALAVAGT